MAKRCQSQLLTPTWDKHQHKKKKQAIQRCNDSQMIQVERVERRWSGVDGRTDVWIDWRANYIRYTHFQLFRLMNLFKKRLVRIQLPVRLIII